MLARDWWMLLHATLVNSGAGYPRYVQVCHTACTSVGCDAAAAAMRQKAAEGPRKGSTVVNPSARSFGVRIGQAASSAANGA